MTDKLDFSDSPPFYVIIAINSLDTLCGALQCQNWRKHVEPICSDWCSHTVEPIRSVLPTAPSYHDYLNGENFSWQSLKEYAFNTSTTALSDLTTPTAFVVLVGIVLLFRAVKAVLLPSFRNLGRRAGRATHGPAWEAQNEVRIVKFGEYVFRLLYHFMISCFGIWLLKDKEWWFNTEPIFEGWPHHEVDPVMTWYYLVQSAYNLEALVSLAELSFCFHIRSPRKNDGWQFPLSVTWSDTVRGDFQEMAIHHVVTNLLVLGSSYFRFHRAGSMVFLVHDISDVPVDLSKLANFLKYKLATAVCFTTMVLLWLIFRLGILPFVIYKSVLYDSHHVLDTVSVDFYICYRYFFYYLVGQIILLHVAWFFMFIRMGILIASKNEFHDLSEHKQGEHQGLAATHQESFMDVNKVAGSGASSSNGGIASGKKSN